MRIRLIFLLVMTLMFLSGCKGQSQYKCGYDTDLFVNTDVFFVDSAEYLNKTLEDLIIKVEKYGIENDYCIANTSKYKDTFNRYSANIQIIKGNDSIHIFGHNGFTLHFAQKNVDTNKHKQINQFCDFISNQVDVTKITYSKNKDIGKLCQFSNN